MLFTVNETAFILDVKPLHVYYLCRMSKAGGAIKVLDCWRIDEASLRELYERIHAERAELFTDDLDFERFENRLEAVRQKYVSDCSGSRPPRLQGRARLERAQIRPDSVVRKKRISLQPSLCDDWDTGNFW